MTTPEFPSKPATATVVLMEDVNHPSAFAFVIVFPDDSKVSVRNPPLKPGQLLDPALCKQFTEHVVAHLLRKNDEAKIRSTNWTSVQAAVQRMILEFNKRQRPVEPGLTEPPVRLQ